MIVKKKIMLPIAFYVLLKKSMGKALSGTPDIKNGGGGFVSVKFSQYFVQENFKKK